MTQDIYTELTNSIISAIENDAGKWSAPWHKPASLGLMPYNVQTGNDYSGINIIKLWLAAETKGYAQNIWGTYKQWEAKGAKIIKGSKCTKILFYKTYEQKNDEGELELRFVPRSYNVFNIEQVEGYEGETLKDIEPANPFEINERIQKLITNSGAVINEGGFRAFYSITNDTITMPEKSLFKETESAIDVNYCSILLHELSHWTGAKKRLDRTFGKRFGDNAYSVEELTAELSAAFLCAKLGISNEPRADHAQYLQSWLKVMKSDSKAIFTAASAASKACDFIMKFDDIENEIAA